MKALDEPAVTAAVGSWLDRMRFAAFSSVATRCRSPWTRRGSSDARTDRSRRPPRGNPVAPRRNLRPVCRAARKGGEPRRAGGRRVDARANRRARRPRQREPGINHRRKRTGRRAAGGRLRRAIVAGDRQPAARAQPVALEVRASDGRLDRRRREPGPVEHRAAARGADQPHAGTVGPLLYAPPGRTHVAVPGGRLRHRPYDSPQQSGEADSRRIPASAAVFAAAFARALS